jgi:hypothetical protein
MPLSKFVKWCQRHSKSFHIGSKGNILIIEIVQKALLPAPITKSPWNHHRRSILKYKVHCSGFLLRYGSKFIDFSLETVYYTVSATGQTKKERSGFFIPLHALQIVKDWTGTTVQVGREKGSGMRPMNMGCSSIRGYSAPAGGRMLSHRLFQPYDYQK